jgi:beta-glucosidase
MCHRAGSIDNLVWRFALQRRMRGPWTALSMLWDAESVPNKKAPAAMRISGPPQRATVLITCGALAALAPALVLVGCNDSQSLPQAQGHAAAAPSTVDPANWPEVSAPLPADPSLEERITRIMSGMSLPDKVGQVIQADTSTVTPDDVRRYRLGSILSGGNSPPMPGADDLSPAARWLAAADAYYLASVDASGGGAGIPILWGVDAVHGHNNMVGATLFPHNIGLGATRNPQLIRRIGEITAQEVRVTGQDWTFAPTLAVARDDRWGRTYESYSEDPEIVRAYAAAMVSGLQGEAGTAEFLDARHVVATAKHFLGDGGTTDGRDQGDNASSEAQLRELHSAGYPPAIATGVQSIMVSFSSWQGTKLHGHDALLSGVLKARMGFDGLLVGDWNAHGQVPGCSNVSCARTLKAGLDMFMAPDSWRELHAQTLAQAQSGEIPAARLDDAVRRILRVKLRARLFESGKPSARPLAGRYDLLGAPEHRAVARQAVRESLVLLKNSGRVLPLRADRRILLAGDGADNISKQCGGWTLTWQGTGIGNAQLPHAESIYAGIRAAVAAAGGTTQLSADGSYTERPDAAIVVFGEDPYAEYEGDLPSVAYSPAKKRDLEVLRRLKGAGIPVVAVLLSGRPLWVNAETNASDAFVAAWLPGSEGGGIADVLLRRADGSINHDFKGKLSFSWPATAAQSAVNRGDGQTPLFAYGYGLTYADAGDVPSLPE